MHGVKRSTLSSCVKVSNMHLPCEYDSTVLTGNKHRDATFPALLTLGRQNLPDQGRLTTGDIYRFRKTTNWEAFLAGRRSLWACVFVVLSQWQLY